MAQSKINIPATGTGDAGPIPVAVKKASTGENVQQFELVTAVEGGAITPIAAGNPLEVAIVGTVPISGAPTTVTANIGTSGSLGLDTSLQSILTKLPSALGAHGGLVIEGVASGVAIPVSGSFSGTTDVATTATITTTGSTTLTGLAGLSTLVLSISSGTQSGVTDLVEGSNDGGTTWATLGTTLNGVNTLLFSSLAAVSGNYMVQIAGYNQVRYRVVAITSGTYNIALRASAGVTNTRTTLLAQGTNTIGALSANQSVNVAQVNGTNTPTNNGVVTAGTQRVTIASDSTGQVKLAAGAALVGSVSIDQSTPGTTNLVALAANQSVNHAQVAGTTTSVNAGTIDAGTQRVAEAGANTGTLTNVAGSATSVTVLASNTARRGATIWNDSTAILYLKFGTTASTTSATVKLVADAYYEVPARYNGRIDGIWASATGNARVTEITA